MRRIEIDEAHGQTLFYYDSYETPERNESSRRDSPTRQIDNTPTIGNDQYANYQTFRRIVIPEGVVKIGDNAFRECKNLTSIVLPPNHYQYVLMNLISIRHLILLLLHIYLERLH